MYGEDESDNKKKLNKDTKLPFENEQPPIIDIPVIQLNNDGTFMYLDTLEYIVNFRLLSPEGDSTTVLLLFYYNKEKRLDCSKCKARIYQNRPILLMDNGNYTYPCLVCRQWIWWPVNERNFEFKFQ